jgi:SNF2 family DNA or RNA helicase
MGYALMKESSVPETKANLATILTNFGYKPNVTEQFQDVNFPFELMPHQIDGLLEGLKSSRFGLFNEARTGKTAIMQGLSIFFSRYGGKSIFIMPPALFTQFKQEFDLISNHGLKIHQFTHSPKKRDQLLLKWRNEDSPDVLIMSLVIFKKHSTFLANIGYKVLFWDECHMGCGKETNQAFKAVAEFADRTEGRLILSTGTPIPNNLYDLYPLIKLKSPNAYPSRRHYDAEHVTFTQIRIRTPFGERFIAVPDHDRYVKTEKITKNLLSNAVRVTKEEALNLEAPNVQIVPVELSTSHMKLYRKVLKDKLFELDGEMVDARQQQKLRQVALQLVSDPEIASEVGKVRENEVFNVIQALLDSVGAYDKEKVVIFANYNNTVEKLLQHFHKYNPATIYGQNGSDVNRKNLTTFREDGTCRLLIANPVSGGVGIKAGDVSQTVIFAEPVSTPAAFDQAASRVMLKGQTKPVSIYILKVLDTLSPSLIDLMMGKAQTMLDVTLDKKSVFDRLLGKI